MRALFRVDSGQTSGNQEWFPPTPKSSRFPVGDGSQSSPRTIDQSDEGDRADSRTPLLGPPARRSRSSMCADTWLDKYIRLALSHWPVVLFGMLVFVGAVASLATVKVPKVVCTEDTTIFLIRHGEKPQGDNKDMLSDEGKCRAKGLPTVFDGTTLAEPDALYTFKPTNHRPSMRGVQTLLPLSVKTDTPIQTFSSGNMDDMIRNIRKTRCGETTLVCWHSNKPDISQVAIALGAPEHQAGEFKNQTADNFDAVWVLDYSSPTANKPASILNMTYQGLGKDPCT